MHSAPHPLALAIKVHHYYCSGVSPHQLAYRQSNWLIAKSAVIVATPLLAHGGVSHEHAFANVTCGLVCGLCIGICGGIFCGICTATGLQGLHTSPLAACFTRLILGTVSSTTTNGAHSQFGFQSQSSRRRLHHRVHPDRQQKAIRKTVGRQDLLQVAHQSLRYLPHYQYPKIPPSDETDPLRSPRQ
jgi:F0F1-type ATP synthase membrane subunit c/vacuolar-type H+-ATPase subunit K